VLDLHTHSTFSDGGDTPDELVRQARAAGLRALALTDHDNARGIPSFLDSCRARGVTGIAGVELSVAVPSGTLHLLGLGIAPEHDELRATVERLLDGRDWRNRRILEKLNALGCALSWEEVAALAGQDVVGRPHFARAMVARGWVGNTQEAFDRFLARGAPAYVDRFRLEPAEALRLIRAAGGLPVIAHPFSWSDDFAVLDARLGELQALGLGGIEGYYPEHTPGQTIDLLRLARRRGLIVTGGSDYHGAAIAGVTLESASRWLDVPDSLLVPLLAAIGPAGRMHLES
jgi:predicted metal-dependent phosphoesterase TrpH